MAHLSGEMEPGELFLGNPFALPWPLFCSDLYCLRYPSFIPMAGAFRPVSGLSSYALLNNLRVHTARQLLSVTTKGNTKFWGMELLQASQMFPQGRQTSPQAIIYADIGEVRMESRASECTKLLKEGWVLLGVYPLTTLGDMTEGAAKGKKARNLGLGGALCVP
jgi:hypothetical protein